MSIGSLPLRLVLVRHGEVLEERFFDKPQNITIGTSKRNTLQSFDSRLEDGFLLLRPSPTGKSYVLRLAHGMTGKLSVNLQELPVSHFLSQGRGVPSGPYRDQPLSSSDWGIIGLDESGDIAVFFQFVAPEVALGRKRSFFDRHR